MQRTPSPDNSDGAIEQLIVAKGVDKYPRITMADIEASIKGEVYCTGQQASFAGGGKNYPELALLTICVLVLQNGFTVVGTSACASPENFDADVGKRIARDNAVRQIWPLLGYLLKERLHGLQQIQDDLRTVEGSAT